MNTYIVFLRGINVGGNCTLPMRELVAILETMGAENVRTYIQSGNVVFKSIKIDMISFSAQLSDEIMLRCGFAPQVHMLTLESLSKAISCNPYPEAVSDASSLHLGFLVNTPSEPDLDKMSSLRKESERFQLIGDVFYLHAPEGIGRSKLAASAEKLLEVTMTMRNWKTVCKVIEMAAR